MGGQAYGWYDRDLASSVKSEYHWQLMNIINELYSLGLIRIPNSLIKDIDIVSTLDIPCTNIEDMSKLLYKEHIIEDTKYRKLTKKYKEVLDSLDNSLKDKIKILAWQNTERETYQAMEGTIYNLNTMHSRAGGQTPFSSVNIGTDTSKEGKLIAKCLLLAYEKGLGKGEQPLFPNIIFKIKKGINYEPNDPNFDLLLLALRVSSIRMFPTFSFQDASINKDFPEDIPIMGCRTRIAWNKHKPMDKQSCEGRGNLSFTSINLPHIALSTIYNPNRQLTLKNTIERYNIKIPEKYKDIEIIPNFFNLLEEVLDITVKQLLKRFNYQCSFKKSDFPFLMNGAWMDSEKLNKNDTLYDMLKHGTLGIGFIGLAETLYALVGEHHGQSKDAQKLGIEIVKFMNNYAIISSEKYNLNFGILGTPAEGLAGKFISKDKNIFGSIKGVTDKEWYTNSFHIPVEFNINIYDKIKLEGEYAKYCAGGSITYVELNESPLGNIKAYYKIIQTMYESDVVYGAINFPADRCLDCGEFGIIEQECPHCKGTNISRIRRITGYLAEESNFNYAKKMEMKNRVSHIKL